MAIELYVEAAELERLQTCVSALPGPADPRAMVALAWGLRQRDVPRAAALAAEAEATLESRSIDTVSKLLLQARIGLIRAESAWLDGKLEVAERELDRCAGMFQCGEDLVGQGDTLLLQSALAVDRGLTAQRKECLGKAGRLYRAAGDVARDRACDAWAATDASGWGDKGRLRRIEEELERNATSGMQATEGLLKFAFAQYAYMEGDYSTAIIRFEAAVDALVRYGLIRTSIAAWVNIAGALGSLGRYERQAGAVETALALARPTGWPLVISTCLYSLGSAYKLLGDFEAAQAPFDEARQRLQGLRSSRTYVMVAVTLGEIKLRLGLVDEAHEVLEDGRLAADRGGHTNLARAARINLATCIARSGQPEQAAEILRQLRSVDDDDRDMPTELQALTVLAELHGAYALAPPDGMAEPTAELHYLEQIWALHAKDRDWAPDEEILGQFSAAWERAGDLRKALDYERWRTRAIAAESNRRAQHQLADSHAQHEADRARREAEHQRRLAEDERARLAVLDHLSLIGQEITTSLDSVEVIQTVDRHVNVMLDATVLSLWLIEDQVLMPAFTQEAGLPVRGGPVALDDPHSDAAAAARDGREILLELQPREVSPLTVSGTRPMLTSLFVPLLVGKRLLGVMSIQSPRTRAYGERERLIFRSICAYSAIAIGNATHYQLLNASHEKLLAIQDELQRAASTDPLTGLYNRRHLMRHAEIEIGRAHRSGLPLAVFLLDLDHFKRINDTFGHAAGDFALKATAEALSKMIRPGDILARYGGEEIVGLLPNTDALGAVMLAERVRATIKDAMAGAGEQRFSLTGSIGVSAWATHEATIEQALARADQALYGIKTNGRNAVKVG